MMTNNVSRIMAMIKKLKVQELVELSKKLQADPNWPKPEGAPVGAKPKPNLPTLTGKAEEVPEEVNNV